MGLGLKLVAAMSRDARRLGMTLARYIEFLYSQYQQERLEKLRALARVAELTEERTRIDQELRELIRQLIKEEKRDADNQDN